MLICHNSKSQKREIKRGGDAVAVGKNENGGFRERVSYFSLEIWAIRPSTVFGTRRRTALRGEGFAWVPNLGSFFKLLEVGVSPYLSFILILSVLRMFELNEAVRGRLISSKSWNRGVRFWKPTWTVRDCPRADLGG